MRNVLLRRSLREAALLWFGCALVLFAFCWIRVWITCQIDMRQARVLMENLPKTWLDQLPVSIERFLTYPGRVGLSFEEPTVYLLVAMWAVARGSDAVSGKIASGTMEMLLAQPISRLHLLWTQVGVMLAGTVLLVAACFGGLAAGIATNSVKVYPEPQVLRVPMLQIPLLPLPTVSEDDVEPEIVPLGKFVRVGMFVPAAVNLVALGVFLGGVTTLLSACDRYRWRTIGIVSGFVIIELMLVVLSRMAPSCAWLGSLTVFSLYQPTDMAVMASEPGSGVWSLTGLGDDSGWKHVGPLGASLLLASLGAVFYSAAAAVFSRRDLPAPL